MKDFIKNQGDSIHGLRPDPFFIEGTNMTHGFMSRSDHGGFDPEFLRQELQKMNTVQIAEKLRRELNDYADNLKKDIQSGYTLNPIVVNTNFLLSKIAELQNRIFQLELKNEQSK